MPNLLSQLLGVGIMILLFAEMRPAFSQPANDTPSIKIGVLVDNYPFSYRNQQGRMEGFAYELVREIELSMGLRFERVQGTTKEINSAFQSKQVALLQSYARFPEREAATDFSVPYLTMAGQIFVRQDETAIKSLADLKGRKVLVHRGSLGDQLLLKAGLGDSISYVDSVEQALVKLDRGEGDATLATRLTGLALAHQVGLKNVRALDVTIEGYDVAYCIAVQKGDSVLLARVNEGMALLVRTGKFDQLYKKWFGFAAPTGYTGEQILAAVAVGLAIALLVTIWAVIRQRKLWKQIVRQADSLRESEERFRQLAENIQEVFWMTDPTTKQVLYLSPAYEKIWGRSRKDIYESPARWLETIHTEDRPRVERALEARPTTGHYDETYRILRPDGGVRWIHDRAFPIRDAAGKIIRLVGTAEDITDQRQLEEQFRQAQKMEAVGQLAGGVAHDFNNLLAVIMMQSELALTETNLPKEARDSFEEIKVYIERAKSLTNQLLTFSRQQVMQAQELDLNDSVHALTKMLQRILGADVSLQLKLHPRPLLTRADAGMVGQILLNLVVNARDAMPDGGTLIIETRETILTPATVTEPPEGASDRFVCLSVTDTGTGIAPEHRPRIFEPFFTTKEMGKGTGIGLATVFGIVKQHGGSISVESEVGRGTTFQILLPATKTEVVAANQNAEKPKPRGGSETILLVEDETSVRRLTHAVLERAGYQVLAAADSVEALRLWEQHPTPIHLLMTDIVLPNGINGRALAMRLSGHEPRLKVIFTSGYSTDFAGRELSLRAGQNFIPKPSPPDLILETIRRRLDQTA